MRPLTTVELLNIWEQGLSEPLHQRVLSLLATALPDTPWEALAQLSIGQRDGYLLTLREWIFGAQLVSLATCPACGGRLELTFGVSDIRVGGPSFGAPGAVEEHLLSVAGHDVRFRLANSADLAAAASSADVSSAWKSMLGRCLQSVRRENAEVALDDLPGEVIDAAVQAMGQADPQADVRLALTCPVCGHRWQALFDIAAYLWVELDNWARRTLYEVHDLALRYGWREADILAMSPQRRRLYLEMTSR